MLIFYFNNYLFMQEMKITKLTNYFKKTWFQHVRNTNLPINIKHKIYESYAEKMRHMSKNRFCSYLEPFWISKTRIKEIIKIGIQNKPQALEYIFWKMAFQKMYLLS